MNHKATFGPHKITGRGLLFEIEAWEGMPQRQELIGQELQINGERWKVLGVESIPGREAYVGVLVEA